MSRALALAALLLLAACDKIPGNIAAADKSAPVAAPAAEAHTRVAPVMHCAPDAASLAAGKSALTVASCAAPAANLHS